MLPVINDEGMAQYARNAIKELYPHNEVVSDDFPVFYASETFSNYSNKYPGVFALLGIKNPDYGSGAEHHNEKFDIDENVLKLGVEITVKYVTFLMEKGKGEIAENEKINDN